MTEGAPINQWRHLLRGHTRRLHQALDQHPRLVGLSDPAIPGPAYADALKALYPGFAWLGWQLSQPHADIKVPVEPRTALLVADIYNMGERLPEPLSATEVTVGTSPAFWLGVCYVHEGARLGGQMIYQQLNQRSDLALTFFGAARQASAWEALWRAVDDIATVEAQRELLAGADCGFKAVLQGAGRTQAYRQGHSI